MKIINRLCFFCFCIFLQSAFCKEMMQYDNNFYVFENKKNGFSSSIIDFGEKNIPISENDRVFVRNGRFFTIGKDHIPNTSDDKIVRFFGVNLSFAANFPDKKDAAYVANQLRRLGVDIVRFHHMDTLSSANPDDIKSILTDGPYPSFNQEAMDRLRYFIKELGRNGIYSNLNLHVGYEFRPSVDNVYDLPVGYSMPMSSKPLHMLDSRMIELQKIYAHKLLSQLDIKNNPEIAAVEINNEASLLYSWSTGLLERSVHGKYRDDVENKWRDFLKINNFAYHELNLSSKFFSYGSVDEIELIGRFLISLENAYYDSLYSEVRLDSGELLPIIGSQMNFAGLFDIKNIYNMDYVDAHFYIDHYFFPKKPWDFGDWRIKADSVLKTPDRLLNVAAMRICGKPFVVSEYNQPWPGLYSAYIVPLLSVFGGNQGWDGMYYFEYASTRDWYKDVPRAFGLIGDWTKQPAFGQSSFIFRSGLFENDSEFDKLNTNSKIGLFQIKNKLGKDVLSSLESFYKINQESFFYKKMCLDPSWVISDFGNKKLSEGNIENADLTYSKKSKKIFFMKKAMVFINSQHLVFEVYWASGMKIKKKKLMGFQ